MVIGRCGANILTGSLAILVFSNVSSAAAEDTATDSNTSATSVSADVDIVSDDAVIIEVCAHGEISGGTWSANSSQTVLLDGNGDDGDTADQATGVGYKFTSSAATYTESWSFSDSALRIALACAAFKSASAPIETSQVEQTNSYTFTANIDQSYTFPSSLTDSVLLVGIAVECTGTTLNDSLASAANWNHAIQGATALTQVDTVTALSASKHQRVTWYELANPDDGAGDIEITFNTVGSIDDGSMVVYALSDTNQNGPDITAQYTNVASTTATANITPLYADSLVLTICSHGAENFGPWTAQTGQTVVIDADSDNGATTNQDAASGYRALGTVQQYTETWNHSGTSLRSVMSALVYSGPEAQQAAIGGTCSHFVLFIT